MKIIYCHHANRATSTPPSQQDDITALGEQEALLVADLFEKVNTKQNIVAVYSSPIFRCDKTAKIVSSKLNNIPIFYDERLNEKGYDEGEDWVVCQTRTQNAILDILKKHNNSDTIIVVTSGVNVASFINLAYGITPNQNVPYIGVPMCCPLVFNLDKDIILKQD